MFRRNVEAMKKRFETLLTKAKLMFKISLLFCKGGYSSAGRALAWHARGQRFDPAYLHHQNSVVKCSKALSEKIMSPSSRGLGHHPFTVSTGVRIP
ncbi:hypothetical protein PSAC2689_90088 [Paraburkholderia sacchari]